ncbi:MULTISPECIES: putative 2-aminoethylphosphonate ABC transporter substrate-binding protein [Pseudomonas]|uniref:2-aminoethylphosphonate ABC transporter substrate-binding protein n=1 Tax=Pseudomonas gessardii TaxID=78544 RepID=A0A7Y1MM35_9PSED|nr:MULTISPECIES: putative 2-aminoethylphosphonate ABC transporter substrate-binding protein [Pseudomonas]MBH3424381.1 putative 2-aminoethylphosphonate ABC transporter substrate-binding protein [Pseudomonas gessardii]MCF4977490.1 putative 2-aminoethylphosphonate ABC transporter substrate-binding protein [Pseudomonas gessardii]MCF4990865.1 putative 2-aminoethylphosphonate ABC transporter substrate-binding protein [Pseudomonas gessardii]MCF5083181.1 putative 2-aminoethylphosphonate ABC transporter
MFKPLALAAAVLTAFSLNAFAAKTELTVYTALEAEQLKTYKKAFEAANPDVEIKWVRDSTGIITAKLLAEKARPQADAVWGLAASSLAILDQQGMLQSYAPKDLDKIGKNYRDAANPPAWVGMDVWAATICFNTVEAEKQGLSKPISWQDLTKPEYKGKIVMPNPASSGTGFLDVSAWLQTFGEKQGWQYMDDLHQNIGQYVHSGSKPCKLAASGEFPIGISFEYPAVQLKRQGAPLDIVLPKEGLGWDIEATALIKGTAHQDAAQKLADFSASPAAMELYKENFAVLAQPGIAKPQTELPADYEQRLIKNDFAWASKNRDSILAEWRKRYDGKSEKVAGQ